ncbi:hypothetical protein LXL04_024137 [Taraxacum kok-saghyz]
MANTGGDLAPPQRRAPPMLTLAPRSSSDTFLTEISPGPMTLVSNFFSDHYPDADLRSLSQLLAGVIPSPTAEYPPPHCSDAPLLSAEESLTPQTSDPDESQIRSPENAALSQSDDSMPEPVVGLSQPDGDGYNWRKYGQKQVKASELPRSYYRCKQINCKVTKKIGHFLDGSTSEIIYSGRHNHEPPELQKPVDADEKVINQRMPKRRQIFYRGLIVCRKSEGRCVDRSDTCRVVVTDPKIVVQTKSVIDVLEDGFKWRKYGQKVVKGSIYPRSYYRCTYSGCKVRKHVERVSADLESVVTTYEGRHKHEIPVLAKHTKIPILLQLKEETIMM